MMPLRYGSVAGPSTRSAVVSMLQLVDQLPGGTRQQQPAAQLQIVAQIVDRRLRQGVAAGIVALVIPDDVELLRAHDPGDQPATRRTDAAAAA